MRFFVCGLLLLAIACVDFDTLGRNARARNRDGGVDGVGGGSTGGGMAIDDDAGLSGGGAGGGQSGTPDAGQDGGTVTCQATTGLEVGWVRNVKRSSGTKNSRNIDGSLLATKDRLALVVAEEDISIRLATSRLLLYDSNGQLIRTDGQPFDANAGDPNQLGDNPDTFSVGLGGLLLGADIEDDSLVLSTANLDAAGGIPMVSAPRLPTITFVNTTKATSMKKEQSGSSRLLGGLHFVAGAPLSGPTQRLGLFTLEGGRLGYSLLDEKGNFTDLLSGPNCSQSPRRSIYSTEGKKPAAYALARCEGNSGYTLLDTQEASLVQPTPINLNLGQALLADKSGEPMKSPLLGFITALNELRFVPIEASRFGRSTDVGNIGKPGTPAELLAMAVTDKGVYVAIAAPEGTEIRLGCLPAFQVKASELVLASFDTSFQLRWVAPFPGTIKVRTNALAVSGEKLFMEATCLPQKIDDQDVLNICDPSRTNSLLYLRGLNGGEL